MAGDVLPHTRVISERIYHYLLLAYPPEFRQAFGHEMAQVFSAAYQDTRRQGGDHVLLGLWLFTFYDLLPSALSERLSQLGGRDRTRERTAVALIVALLVGLAIGYNYLHSDEVYTTVILVLVTNFVGGFLQPARAQAGSLLVGVGTPLAHLAAVCPAGEVCPP